MEIAGGKDIDSEKGEGVWCERGSENNINPHRLQRIGTSLQYFSASSFLWLVGDVWALKLPTSSPKTGVAR